ILLTFGLIVGVLVLGIGVYGYQKVIEQFPIEEVISEVYTNEDFVSLEAIDKIFLDSIVAIEDHRFYQHGAIDPISIMRATVNNLVEGEITQGGSTITQQLVKNLFLENEQTYTRKIKEIFIAHELEQHYSKDEILELYVNAIYYGDGYYGIADATLGYFQKEPSDLTYEEATLLAGLPQAPSAYALSTNYEKALLRQKQVISALKNQE
ncbi:MAG: transglycosylase domain-containing protein, partial [Turicibacter sp.]